MDVYSQWQRNEAGSPVIVPDWSNHSALLQALCGKRNKGLVYDGHHLLNVNA